MISSISFKGGYLSFNCPNCKDYNVRSVPQSISCYAKKKYSCCYFLEELETTNTTLRYLNNKKHFTSISV